MLEVLVLELILTDDEDDWVKVGGDDFLGSLNQVHWFAAGAFDVDQMFLVSPGQEYRSGNLL